MVVETAKATRGEELAQEVDSAPTISLNDIVVEDERERRCVGATR